MEALEVMVVRLVALCCLFAVALIPMAALAHSGQVDAQGCHHEGKTGEYHCHRPAADTAYVGVASVIDGDTIEIHGQRYRLSGIDAPESKQLCSDAASKTYRCGQVAANALAAFIGRQTVSCVKVDIDRYRRIVAECSVEGGDVGRYMVSSGLAVAYRKYSTAYVPDEEAAHFRGIGVWSGSFEMPWLWRKAH
jgi:endonuclease YncB( thermonuclease family)